jgi:hypothetical protein
MRAEVHQALIIYFSLQAEFLIGKVIINLMNLSSQTTNFGARDPGSIKAWNTKYIPSKLNYIRPLT